MTKIEWTRNDDGSAGQTWNPTTGCDQISSGCDNCYALTMAGRLKLMGQEKYQNDGDPRTSGPGFALTIHPDTLDVPLRRKKPTTYFVNSMSDLFHADVPPDFIAEVWQRMAITPRHTYQILTKRPQRMRQVLTSPEWMERYVDIMVRRGEGNSAWPLPGVWLGTSIESDRYTFRADHLRATPAAVRFLSLEPLLGPLPSLDLTGIDWVIAGGESGPGARPMHPAWVRDIRNRCQAEGVAFFFKQWGAWAPADRSRATHLLAQYGLPRAAGGVDDPSLITIESGTTKDPYGPGSGVQDLVDRGHPGWVRVRNVGKKAAGRELDGRTWDEMPR